MNNFEIYQDWKMKTEQLSAMILQRKDILWFNLSHVYIYSITK